jgi:hypothetical protein
MLKYTLTWSKGMKALNDSITLNMINCGCALIKQWNVYHTNIENCI